MDLVIQTSLEALLLKATNPQNQNIDTAAVDAFCIIVNKEKDGAHIGAKVLAARLPSGDDKEMLQTLSILDVCMEKCGSQFQSEIGKFRFLNEMIKLVSPKYLGSHTPLNVKQKVLQMMHAWTVDYPKESKIKEAYDMLRKQGVVREGPSSASSTAAAASAVAAANQHNLAAALKKKTSNSVFQDEEKSRILQKLLQSKDPEDIQAANWLIKSMVKEDDKRAELKSRRISEIESIQNNISLLDEMLDNYRPDRSSSDELDLIKELCQSCERLRPTLMRLASEAQEEILGDVLQTTEVLGQVFKKYGDVIVKGKIMPSSSSLLLDDVAKSSSKPLLDFETSLLATGDTGTMGSVAAANKLLCQNILTMEEDRVLGEQEKPPRKEIDALCDIFTTSPSVLPDDGAQGEILQPTTSLRSDKMPQNNVSKKKPAAPLEDLDVLSEHLSKECLSPSGLAKFNKNAEKIPMNLLATANTVVPDSLKKSQNNVMATTKTGLTLNDSLNLDLNYLLHKATAKEQLPNNNNNSDKSSGDHDSENKSGVDKSNKIRVPPDLSTTGNDDFLVDISDEKMLSGEGDLSALVKERTNQKKDKADTNAAAEKSNIIKLNEIEPIRLDQIKPSDIPPLTVLNEKNGMTVTLHFARDKPRDDVHVFVITTISKNQKPISNYLFQAVVPQGCKLKLQPPSSTSLPAFNAFLPPSAITQIMLIACSANATKGDDDNVQIYLKFIVSYVMDEETFTEMGEVDSLPLL